MLVEAVAEQGLEGLLDLEEVVEAVLGEAQPLMELLLLQTQEEVAVAVEVVVVVIVEQAAPA